jgi:hypothetical protein
MGPYDALTGRGIRGLFLEETSPLRLHARQNAQGHTTTKRPEWWLGFPGRQFHIGANAPAHFIRPTQGSLARLKLAIGDDHNIRISLR